MKHMTGFGYFAAVALFAGALVISSNAALAGNGYGKDNNPGKANGHAENGGPAGGGNGGMPSAMGSLNAAHASSNGLAHANPRSRVGMLAAYMDAMVVYEAEYAAISEEDWETHEDLMQQISDIDDQIAGLEEDINQLDPEDPNHETDKEDLKNQIAGLEEDKADLQEQADAITAGIDAAAEDAAGHLKDAANKDGLIDETVVDNVNSLLDGKSEDFTHSDVVHGSEPDIVELINPSE